MNLTAARKALEWGPRDVDRKAGLPLGTTQSIELGRNANPSWTIVSAITEAFHEAGLTGLTAHDLFPTRDAHAR